MLSIPLTPSQQTYLSHLTSIPLEKLTSEPSVLQTQSHHLTSSLTSLTHTSYPTFLTLHTTTKALSQSLETLSSSLDTLITESLPTLENTVNGWKNRTDGVLRERHKARVVLDQHDKIRDMLDIPVLIDACVRNGFFSEALSLASHASTIAEKAYASEAPPLILDSILAQVQQAVTHMLCSLLATLHESNRKLPALWKAVNFLRKMDVFTEPHESADVQSEDQIALAFLSGRNSCDVVDKDQEDFSRYIKKYIDVWREGVHDLIMQFHTIFLERTKGVSDASVDDAAFQRLHTLLTTYALHALNTYLLPTISEALPCLPLASIPSILTQLTYCANAFARVGFDYSGAIGGIMCKAIRNSAAREERAAVDAVAEKRKSSFQEQSRFKKPSEWLVLPSQLSMPASSPSALMHSHDASPHQPPLVLASYPPMVDLTNAILTTFNSLRLVAPVDISLQLLEDLDAVLQDCAESLKGYIVAFCGDMADEPPDSDSDDAREKGAAISAGEVYFTVFVPYIRTALMEGVYGQQLLMEPGEPGSMSQSLESVCREWGSWLEGRRIPRTSG
ncbi:Dor1-domain-containing protein [Fistulina hepatica ATCC 64428]|uniref:Conserved oligomeric Golgi complex subunit 8 n=1 Tax=Fistulina hepatica ATCC 64428 TaxID=1128425 RepID=A0A0D7AGD9_9AGAR|nr:Dor1-domain-containing protein [Fistulina hepatica ATCC 64428]